MPADGTIDPAGADFVPCCWVCPRADDGGMRTRTTQALRRCFEVAWVLTAGAGCALGLLVSLDTSGALVVVSLFVATALLAVIVVVTAWLSDLECRVRPILVGASACGLVVVVAMGLGRALGPMSFVIVLVVLLTSPYTFDAVRRARRRGSGRPAPLGAGPTSTCQTPLPLPDDPGFSIPDQMTVADLCQAWRSSYVALERAMPDSRLRVVEIRAIYLDELERRAGPAMQAWLRSRPRAAGDPSRWVTGSESTAPMR